MTDRADPPSYASAATTERRHAENNARWESHSEEHRDLEKRVSRGEFDHERVKESLRAGNERFSSMDKAIEAKSFPWRWVISVAGLPVVGLIVWLAQAPGRSEMDAAKARIETVEKAVIETRGDIKALTASIERAGRRGAVVPLAVEPRGDTP